MRGEHATEIEVDSIRSTLEPARKLRLALDVLWGELPGRIGSSDAIDKALLELHEKICAAELSALVDYGINRQYVIVRPINMLRPPDQETMEKIIGAIQVLDGLGMIAGPGDI